MRSLLDATVGTGGAGRFLLDFFRRFKLFMSTDELFVVRSPVVFVRFVLLSVSVQVVINDELLCDKAKLQFDAGTCGTLCDA